MTETYEYGIDVDALDAVDFHTHVEIDADGRCAYDAELARGHRELFQAGRRLLLPRRRPCRRTTAQHNTAAVVFTIDAHTVSGHRPNSVEDLIDGAARNNDVLIPFGTVDPWDSDARAPGA